MDQKAQQVSLEVVAIIEQTIQERMAPFGLKEVSVQAGEDHDGDPVLFIDARYELTDTPVDTSVVAKLTSLLRDRLWAAGESRFPHIRHKFDERQKIKPRGRARA